MTTHADSPTDLPRPSVKAAVRRTFGQFKHDNLTDLAAALTYYGVLAMFPGFIVLVSILGLLGRNTTDQVVSNVRSIAPGSVGTFVDTVVRNAQDHHAAAGAAAVIGVLLALWSASGYVAAFMRASNVIYGIGEGRPIWKTIPIRLGVTVLMVLLLVVDAAIVVVTGPVARRVGDLLGVGSTAVTVWEIAKWPVLLVVVAVMLAILFWAGPNAQQGGIAWVSPGGVISVLIWLVVSGLFAVYVADFSSYSNTYGSLAGVIVFLVWLWLTNIAVLFGAEVNAELDHARAIADGLPDDADPFAVPRDTRAMDPESTRRVEQAAALRSRH